MATPIQLRHFIGGAFVDGFHDARRASRNPSQPDDIVAEAPEGSDSGVDKAVGAARDAHQGWRAVLPAARGNALYAWAEAVQARAEEIAQLVCREVGKPISEARGEAARCVALLRYYAGEAVRPSGDVLPSNKPISLQYSFHAPVGVAGLITPWNFPVAIPIWKAAPAIAFGNAVVLKPSELSPACAGILAETATAAGLPAGVFNVLYGAGPTGSALVAHEGVRLVSFTGSSGAGSRVAASAAARNVKYQTEMGGKNVGIVLADAEVSRAAGLVAGGAMRYAGQKCTATSRVIVDRKMLGRFVDELKAQISKLPLGPVNDAAAAIGPVITEPAREKVLAALDQSGGEIALGGTQKPAGDFANGHFIEPTVVCGVKPDDEIAQVELFGPVLAVIEADGIDEALAIANDVRYGLSASLYTSDIRAALTYVDRIEVGLVRINGDTTGVDPYAPFGGVKASGSHSREQGQAAREFYTEIKTVELNG